MCMKEKLHKLAQFDLNIKWTTQFRHSDKLKTIYILYKQKKNQASICKCLYLGIKAIIFFSCQNYNDEVYFKIFQLCFINCIKRLLFHIGDIQAELWIIMIYSHIEEEGASGCEASWSWVCGPFFEHQSLPDTGWGGCSSPHQSLTPFLPSTLQHRTCSGPIKVRQPQSDDSNGLQWEGKQHMRRRERRVHLSNFNAQITPFAAGACSRV